MAQPTFGKVPEPLNAWNLSPLVFSQLEQHLGKGDTVLEFGSGDGTKRLLEMGFAVQSIEHDRSFVMHENTIVPDISNGWYDHEVVRETVSRQAWDAVVIDGPTGDIGRAGVILYWRDFVESRVIVVDDTHRADDEWIATSLTRLLPSFQVDHFDCGNDKKFTLLHRNNP